MAEDVSRDMLNEEVAFNLVTISAIMEFLEGKFPGAKEEIYAIGRSILENESRAGGLGKES